MEATVELGISVASLEAGSPKASTADGRKFASQPSKCVEEYVLAKEKGTPWLAPIHTDGPSFDNVYDVSEEIGRGGYGSVWRCTHRSTGKEFAVKFMDLDELTVRGKLFPNMIERELRTMQECSHPCIVELVQVFDRREAEGRSGTLHMVLELCPGTSLQGIIDKMGAIPEEKAKVVFAGVGSAVKYLHRQGTVHRDIKPGNIVLLWDEQGGSAKISVKLLDFGLARETKTAPIAGSDTRVLQQRRSKKRPSISYSGSRRRLSMSTCGTRAFAAPEMTAVLGNGSEGSTPGKVGSRAVGVYAMNVDEFSLGQTLKNALTGCPPDVPVSEFVAQQGGLMGCFSCLGGGSKVELKFMSELSPEAREVISGLTDKNPGTRMSLDDFLSHPWLGDAGAPAKKWAYAAMGGAEAGAGAGAGDGMQEIGVGGKAGAGAENSGGQECVSSGRDSEEIGGG